MTAADHVEARFAGPPEAVDPRSLVAHARNYRRHPKAQLAALRASMRRNGPQPTVVARPSDRVILAGHGVVAAAIAEKMPTVLVCWWETPEAEAKAYLVADNEVSRLADDDQAALAAILDSVASATGLDGTGWSDGEVERLLRDIGPNIQAEGDGDLVDIPKRPRSRPGVYRLGRHRLAYGPVGGATIADALGGATAGAVVADVGKPHDDAIPMASVLEVLDAATRVSRPGAVWWLLGKPGPAALPLLEFLRQHGIWRQTLVWTQTGTAGHRNVIYGWVPGGSHTWLSDRKQTSLVDVNADNSARPWALSARLTATLLAHNVTRRDVVLDPFAGYGSTLIGAAMAGSRWCGAVSTAAEADVVRRRWTRWAAVRGIDPGDDALGE